MIRNVSTEEFANLERAAFLTILELMNSFLLQLGLELYHLDALFFDCIGNRALLGERVL